MIDNRNIIVSSATVSDALEKLNSLSGEEMTLIVVDSPNKLEVCGTLTNGDVRRALLRGITLEQPVSEAMFKEFRRIEAEKADNVDDIREMRNLGIRIIPVVDKSGKLVDIMNINEQSVKLPLSVILMAGGKGERLRPLTLTKPKPLLEVDGKAIIDYNIEALSRVGIDDITVTTRYLAEQIEEHFRTPVAGLNVKCVSENMPMGTIGSAALVERKPGGNTLIMNSDLLTTVSFEDMYIKHRDFDADVTVGVIPYQVSVPYAILGVDGDNVTSIDEKPAFSHYANAGIYIFRNEILDALPNDKPTDAPDLIRSVIQCGGKVTYHVINGTWIDIGSPTDYRQAGELMRHHRNLSRRG